MIKNLPKTAIVFRGVKYSYTQLLQYSEQYSRTFLSLINPQLSIQPKVLVFADNCPEYYFVTYGAFKCNACLVPVDVQSTAKEILGIVAECFPEIIFVSEHYKETISKIVCEIQNYQYTILSPSDIDISNIEEISAIEMPVRNDDQVAAIIYTSGTTGQPKGVMLSFKNLWYNIDAVSNYMPVFQNNSNVLVLLPLHHIFPFAASVLVPIYAGGTCWITDGMKPDAILQTLKEGKITIITGVPRLYEMLAKGVMAKINASILAKTLYKLAALLQWRTFSKIVFTSVHKKFGGHIQYLNCGGAPLPIEVAKIYRTLGFYMLEGYGMTECAPMIAFTRIGEWRYEYVGPALPRCEIKIGENNEILVRGDNVMSGYYKRPVETAEIMKDGWLHTGDTGVLDNFGLRVTGRIKEIIVASNGKNINPVEIEYELLKHSVFMKEIAVFLHNDQLHLLIYPEMSAVRLHSDGDLEELLKDEVTKYNKNAMNYKRIQQIHVVSEELPKNRLGKVQRFKLEEFIHKKEKKPDEDIESFSYTYKILRQFIDRELNISAHADDHFEIDLAMDSLSKLSLLTFIENTFALPMKAQQLDEFYCLEKLSQFVEKFATEYNDNEVSWKEILQTEKPDMKLPRYSFTNWITVNLIKIIAHSYFYLRGKGKQYIPDQPVIFVANHRSGLDGAFVLARLPWKRVKNTYMFAKDKHFRLAITRFLAPRNNIILMNINTNLRESIVQMNTVLKQGKNVIIFPEGTRSKDKKMKEFKDMFAILSQELNIPILPIAISGSERAAFRFKRIPRPFTKIFVEFLPPIYPDAEENLQELKKRVRLALENAL